jgi:hypothetical protein
MRVAWAGGAAVIGLLVTLMTMSRAVPVGAATEPVTGTVTTSGGNGITTADLVYATPGVLGSGTIHFDFVLIPDPPGFRSEGTGVLTRSDGATLTGTETSTVDLTTTPVTVVVHFTVTSGTGALAGATGEIVLTGTVQGPERSAMCSR